MNGDSNIPQAELLSVFRDGTLFPHLEYLSIAREACVRLSEKVPAMTKTAFSAFQLLQGVNFDSEIWDSASGNTITNMPTLEQWRDKALEQ